MYCTAGEEPETARYHPTLYYRRFTKPVILTLRGFNTYVVDLSDISPQKEINTL